MKLQDCTGCPFSKKTTPRTKPVYLCTYGRYKDAPGGGFPCTWIKKCEHHEEIKKEPRFRYCQEIGCPDRYVCKQKLEVFSACGGYGLDYFCRKAGKVVYRD